MKNEKPVKSALALSGLFFVLYVVYATVIALFPNSTNGLVRAIYEGLNLAPPQLSLFEYTFSQFFVGLISISLVTFCVGYLFRFLKIVFLESPTTTGYFSRRPTTLPRT